MIVREILDPKYEERILAHFDYFNDFKDTVCWLSYFTGDESDPRYAKAKELTEKLTAGEKDWLAKRNAEISERITKESNPEYKIKLYAASIGCEVATNENKKHVSAGVRKSIMKFAKAQQ